MTQECVRLVECSRERQLPRDGNNAGKLMELAGTGAGKYRGSHALRGFFLRTRKTVSNSSRYLVK